MSKKKIPYETFLTLTLDFAHSISTIGQVNGYNLYRINEPARQASSFNDTTPDRQHRTDRFTVRIL